MIDTGIARCIASVDPLVDAHRTPKPGTRVSGWARTCSRGPAAGHERAHEVAMKPERSSAARAERHSADSPHH
jgi:hypothetical protein